MNESKKVLQKRAKKSPVKRAGVEGIKTTPKMFRRAERARKNYLTKRRNDGKVVKSAGYVIGMTVWGYEAIYAPGRKKLKGWQRENRKYSKIS